MKSEGVRRLSLLAGGLGLLLNLHTIPEVWRQFNNLFVAITIVPAVSFFVPWAAVRLIAWVVQGFLSDRRNRSAEGDDQE